MKTEIIKDKDYDGYEILTQKLEDIDWALEGKCDDIDCDKYMYKEMLKKKYKPVLEHNFSCMANLKRDKKATMRLLSLPKFKKFRYKNCFACKRKLDKLSDKSIIVSFTRPSIKDKRFIEWNGEWAHEKCEKRVKVPIGWTLF